MKRSFLKTFVVIIPLLFTACSKNKNAIHVVTNYDLVAYKDNPTVDMKKLMKALTADEIILMSKNKGSFMLYFHSTHCSACETVSENYRNYLESNHYLIYTYDVMNNDYLKLHEYNETTFPEQASTPRILIIKEGKFVDEVANGKLFKQSFFNPAMNSFLNSTNVSEVKTLYGLNKYLENNKDPNVYLYNSLDESSYSLYVKKIDDNDEKSLFIDTSHCNEDLLAFALANYSYIS